MATGSWLTPELANYWAGQQAGATAGGGALGAGASAAMMANPWLGAAIGFGVPLLQGLAGLVQGESWQSKNKKQVFKLMQNRLGQSVLDPSQYMNDMQRAMAPKLNRQGEAINKRLGLDSGVAQGELAYQASFPLMEYFAQAKMMDAQMRTQRDMALLQSMASLTQG